MNKFGRVGLEIHQKKRSIVIWNFNILLLQIVPFAVIYFIPMLFTARVESNCLKEKEKNAREDIEDSRTRSIHYQLAHMAPTFNE